MPISGGTEKQCDVLYSRTIWPQNERSTDTEHGETRRFLYMKSKSRRPDLCVGTRVLATPAQKGALQGSFALITTSCLAVVFVNYTSVIDVLFSIQLYLN